MLSRTKMLWLTPFLIIALDSMVRCRGTTVEDVNVDTAFDSATMAMEDILDHVTELRSTVYRLAKQVRTQQLFVEERIRSDGNSGIKQVRTTVHGTESYHNPTHIGIGAAGIYDRSSDRDTLGMADVVAVLNGVEFRTRHNGYQLVRPSTSSKDFHAVEPLVYPDVPPEVLNAGDVDAQIAEMTEWFKAFHRQDKYIRDYTKYFKPVLCYMEGAWLITDDIKSMPSPQQEVHYYSASGSLNVEDPVPFLPTKIVGFNETTLEPIYARWDYRILCHPIEGDVPTEYFRQQNDLVPQAITRSSLGKVGVTRAARYKLTEESRTRFTHFELLDRIMQAIPGVDNIPDFYNEEPMNLDLISRQFNNQTLLNTGFYHRMFTTKRAGAMGIKTVNRGFSDEFLFVAETSQERVAPFDIYLCKSRRVCLVQASRFTYAIPLEVVYLTPLLKWNPYDLELFDNYRIPSANGRTGRNGAQTAYNGTAAKSFFYRTPESFFSTLKGDAEDPADTMKKKVEVLDKNGEVRVTTPSGTRILLPFIKGVGQVRLRYPIYPVHDEGSTNWKELTVVKQRVEDQKVLANEEDYHIRMGPSLREGLGNHTHEFHISKEDFKALTGGDTVSVTTSIVFGHSHNLDIYFKTTVSNTQQLQYFFCDNLSRCWDEHAKPLVIVSAPEDDEDGEGQAELRQRRTFSSARHKSRKNSRKTDSY